MFRLSLFLLFWFIAGARGEVVSQQWELTSPSLLSFDNLAPNATIIVKEHLPTQTKVSEIRPPFFKYSLMLGPYAHSILVEVTVSLPEHEYRLPSPQFTLTSLGHDTSIHYQNILTQLNALAAEKSESLKAHLLKISEEISDVGFEPATREAIWLNVFSLAANKTNWILVDEVIDAVKWNPNSNIILQCQLAQLYASKGTIALERSNQVLSSQLAEALYELSRNQGELSDDEKHGISRAQYVTYCLPSLTKLLNHTTTQSAPEKHAEALFAQALQYLEQLDTISKAKVLSNLWLFYNFNDRHAEAETASKTALSILTNQTNYLALKVELIDKLFTSLIRRGAYAEAKHYLQIGLALEPEKARNLTIPMLFNMGFLNYYVGEFAIAKHYFQQSITQYERISSPLIWTDAQCSSDSSRKIEIARSALMIGSMYRELADPNNTDKWHNCAQTLLINSADYYQVVTLVEQAKAAFARKDHPLTMKLARAVINDKRILTTQKIDALTLILSSKITQGELEGLIKDLDLMASYFGFTSYYNKDYADSQTTPYPIKQLAVLRLLIVIHKDDSDSTWQDIFVKKAIQIIQANINNVANPQAWNAARFSFIASYIDSMFEEKNERWRVSNEKLFSILENYYSLAPQTEKNLYTIDSATRSLTENVNRLKQGWQNQNVDRQIDKLSGNKVTALPLQTIQTSMHETDLLIRYFFTEKKGHALIISKDDISIRTIGTEETLTQQIAEYITTIKTVSDSRAIEYRLAAQMLPLNLLNSVAYKKLIVIPDGRLHEIPFASLNISADAGRYKPLIQRIEIVSSSSASQYYQEIPLASLDSLASIAVFADPSFVNEEEEGQTTTRQLRNANTVKSIPGSQQEAQVISQLFGHLRLKMALQKDANNAFLMDPESRNASILHISTHGYFDPQQPDNVGLITTSELNNGQSTNGFLSLSELVSKPINNQLVVISGCETLLGRQYKGSGMRSMTRGFLSQGAGSVIGTLWPIQDKATAVFMSTFYQVLKQSKGNVSYALHHTQTLFSKQGAYRHPKYWAGFILNVSNRQYETINLR